MALQRGRESDARACDTERPSEWWHVHAFMHPSSELVSARVSVALGSRVLFRLLMRERWTGFSVFIIIIIVLVLLPDSNIQNFVHWKRKCISTSFLFKRQLKSVSKNFNCQFIDRSKTINKDFLVAAANIARSKKSIFFFENDFFSPKILKWTISKEKKMNKNLFSALSLFLLLIPRWRGFSLAKERVFGVGVLVTLSRSEVCLVSVLLLSGATAAASWATGLTGCCSPVALSPSLLPSVSLFEASHVYVRKLVSSQTHQRKCKYVLWNISIGKTRV